LNHLLLHTNLGATKTDPPIHPFHPSVHAIIHFGDRVSLNERSIESRVSMEEEQMENVVFSMDPMILLFELRKSVISCALADPKQDSPKIF
jgi:hypothetical protein